MVPLLTHLYTEGYSSLHTLLEFAIPLALVAFCNLITVALRIREGLTRRGRTTSLFLLFVNMIQLILYVSMTMTKAPDGPFIWGITVFVLTFMLTAAMMALFFVDTTFSWQCVKQFDNRRKESGFPLRGRSGRELYGNIKFPAESAVDPRKQHKA